jgi:hypothetical protein
VHDRRCTTGVDRRCTTGVDRRCTTGVDRTVSQDQFDTTETAAEQHVHPLETRHSHDCQRRDKGSVIKHSRPMATFLARRRRPGCPRANRRPPTAIRRPGVPVPHVGRPLTSGDQPRGATHQRPTRRPLGCPSPHSHVSRWALGGVGFPRSSFRSDRKCTEPVNLDPWPTARPRRPCLITPDLLDHARLA